MDLQESTGVTAASRVKEAEKHGGRHPRVILEASARDGDRVNSICFFCQVLLLFLVASLSALVLDTTRAGPLK